MRAICSYNNVIGICESASLSKYMNSTVSVFVESAMYVTKENKLECLNRCTPELKERSLEISRPQLFLSAQNNNWLVKHSQNTICCA